MSENNQDAQETTAAVEVSEMSKISENAIHSISTMDFDWDSVGKRSSNYSKPERERMESLYEKSLSSITEHEVVEGEIVAMTTKDAVVNIGYKSDGIVALSELRYDTDIKVGDRIIQLDQGEVIRDISATQKSSLRLEDVFAWFA